MLRTLKLMGPGALVAAAFIGPGTVTTATLAGAGYGYTLLWAVVFSTIATMILQEMAIRLGLVGGLGLGEAIRAKLSHPVLRGLAATWVVVAIFVGNSAYEAGNLTGAALGASGLLPGVSQHWVLFILGAISFILLYQGRYALLERALILLVCLLGMVFLTVAVAVQPDWSAVLQGMFRLSVPEHSTRLVLGLLGTTVVPYNLFLHAASARNKWSGVEHLRVARLDTAVSIGLGGVVTGAVLICGAGALHGSGIQVTGLPQLAGSIEVLAGRWATPALAVGFLAAGLSSAVTAPLAAAFASAGVLGWDQGLRSARFRFVWILVLLAGMMGALSGYRPVEIILMAQVANGFLLPAVAVLLVWTMNDRGLLGSYRNNLWQNIGGMVVVFISVLLGGRSIFMALGG